MKSVLFVILFIFTTVVVLADEARLMRFPSILGNQVVFSYAGDLYTVDVHGGKARKLTSHIGYEMFPRISPDGKYVAFTGQYDGNTEVFVIPSEGGEPRRLTYTATLGRDDLGDRMGPNNVVIGWTPDSKSILFRTRQYTFNDFTGQLMTVAVEGGQPQRVPLKNGGFASFSPDGNQLAYNYIFREFRTWKRYQGGMADDIRIFDFKTKKSEKITDHISQDVFPMWAPDGKNIYFLSDRNRIMNLYRYNLVDKSTTQLTFYKDYDIKFPSMGGGQIVYENGGFLYRFNPESDQPEKITVEIDNDQAWSRSVWKDVSKQITGMDVAPQGERIVVVARGDVFSVPAKEGVTYNLTNSSNANDREARWSPDSKWIAYVSDKSGEFNIWLRDVQSGKEHMLTKDLKTYIFTLKWAPDAKSIAWSEKKNTLNVTDIVTGKTRVIATSGISSINDFNWSPDSRYITYVEPGKEMNRIVVYDLKKSEKHIITDGWYSVNAPNFSDDGKYLLFASARTFRPTYSRTEWNHVYNNMNKVYVLPLSADADIPLAPRNDRVSFPSNDDQNIKGISAKKKKETSDAKADKEKELVYDFRCINDKTIELPVMSSDYYDLHMIKGNVYYVRGGQTYMYNLKDKRETGLGLRVSFGPGYHKAIARSGSSFQVIDIPYASVNIAKPVSTRGLRKKIDYQEEWLQIYAESWRQMRDFFYARNMHGVDWEGVFEKYRVLIPYVNHRTDLTYVIGEMIGELSVGHAYSANGEHPEPVRIEMGLLGADLIKDASGYFRVVHILQGANWSSSARSPLTLPGVNVKEGDYILSVNGQDLKRIDDFNKLMVGKAHETVALQVNGRSDYKGAREVLVIPLGSESQLRYYDWVQRNIRRVTEATNGEVGYIHIPDMGVEGLNEFVKHYYPQLGKKALIIDDRGNGGGNVSPMITERLMRTPTFYTMHTNQAEGSVSPVGTFVGPKVLLVNEYSASDGDLFPYRFKYNRIGPVIGRRTWGGVVGYSGTIPVVDGGSIVTPSYAPFAVDGSGFIIEGHGVDPDMVVENDPYQEFNGHDEQLETAIRVILERLQQEKPEKPAIPAFPVK